MARRDDSIILRRACLADVPALASLIAGFAQSGYMLSRSAGELYETIRDFQVVTSEENVVGCVATHVFTDKIAELKSLAVAASVQGQGVGRALVEGCLADAAQIGLERVFCLTYQIDFFDRLGFVKVDRSRLPEKVWGECVRCDKFLACDETAMWAETKQQARVVS